MSTGVEINPVLSQHQLTIEKEQGPQRRPQPKDPLSMETSSVSSESKMSSFLALANIKEIRLAQYICCIVSLAACSYFVSIGYINVALQYTQICFLSSLTVALDADSWWKQRIFFVFSILIAIFWGALFQWAGYKYLDYEIYNYAVLAFSTYGFFLGMLGMAYVAILSTEAKYVELDLLLYLIALNAICFFSTDDTFNSHLHMILDIRTIMLLYCCVYEPKQKIALLTNATFVMIMTLIVISFVFFTYSDNFIAVFGHSCYILIGGMLNYNTYEAYQRFQQRVHGKLHRPEQAHGVGKDIEEGLQARI